MEEPARGPNSGASRDPLPSAYVHLYFTRPTHGWRGCCRWPWLEWVLTLFGWPCHVTVAVRGEAYIVSPALCCQMEQAKYEMVQRRRGAIVAHIAMPTFHPTEAMDAAYVWATGPCPHRELVRRFVTNTVNLDATDCVLAAIMVLQQSGIHDVPMFRTPRGLYKWLIKHPLARVVEGPSSPRASR